MDSFLSSSDKTGHIPVTVIVCTADRGDSLVPTVKSILAARDRGYCNELLVIDQSSNDATARAIAPFLTDPRLVYQHHATKGKGISLNTALAQACHSIVAITDDDVEVLPDWLAGHRETFLAFPKVAVTYGQVLPVPFDTSTGFIPIYLLEHDNHVRTIRDKLRARGIGANMAVRRDVVSALGGFDPALGPGGKFHTCVDGDITVRALLAGYEVYETRKSKVLHYGFRSWKQGRTLAHNAWYGIGAAYSKPLRVGYWRFWPVPAYEFFVHALWPFLKSCVRLKPSGWLRVKAFVSGFATGWRTPVDPTTLRFDSAAPSFTAK